MSVCTMGSRGRVGMRGIGGAWALIACASLFAGFPSVSQAQTQWSANGHVYRLETTPRTWTDAKVAAESSSYRGVTGHLLTITSQAEQDFLINTFGGLLWDTYLGGFLDLGVWKWVTAEPFNYTNWAFGEPRGSSPVIYFDPATPLGEWSNATGTVALPYFVEYELPRLIGWPMELQNRFGNSRAISGPDPGTITTPWIDYRMSPTEVVSHGPAIGADGIGYYGTWIGSDLVKFDVATGAILGSFDALGWIQCTPAIGDNGLIYITTVKAFSQHPPGRIFAVDPNTMDWVWAFQTNYNKVSDYESCSPTIGPDGDIVVGSKIGKAWRLDGATGAIEWEVTFNGAQYTIPFSRDDTKVFVSNDEVMTAINYADGTIAWSYTAGSWFGAPSVAPDGTLVVGSASGTVYGFDPDTGTILWTFTALGKVLAAPAFSTDGVAYVCSYDHRLYALRTSDGARLWSFTGTFENRSSPSVGPDGRIYFGNPIGSLYSVAPDGTLIWFAQSAGSVRGQITVGSDGTLYMGPLGGGLVIIRQHETRNLAESYSIIRGIHVSGDVADTWESDNSYFVVRPGITLNRTEAPVDMVFESTALKDTPSEFRFTLEAHVSIWGMSQRIELFDFVAGSWEEVDVRMATTTDSVVTIDVPANPERFVEPTTGVTRVRVSFKQAGPILQFPWFARINFAGWRMVPKWIPV